jgi:hypothetical protein
VFVKNFNWLGDGVVAPPPPPKLQSKVQSCIETSESSPGGFDMIRLSNLFQQVPLRG